jgi:hypothetical protein
MITTLVTASFRPETLNPVAGLLLQDLIGKNIFDIMVQSGAEHIRTYALM